MVEPTTVLACYRDGVEALAGLGERLEADAWAIPVCGVWDGTELAGHVLVVAGWYHDWLDRAEAGASDRPFLARELAARNQAALTGLRPEGGPARLSAFRDAALGYADRVADRWDLRYGFPYGTVTAGQHAGLAAMEWHAHAWDLARAAGEEYRPADPDGLVAAVTEGWSRRVGPVRGALARTVAPAMAAWPRDRWLRLLARTGRRGEPAPR
jgi:Mycothiol maleylpyruvate isomerase N-terminal domain